MNDTGSESRSAVPGSAGVRLPATTVVHEVDPILVMPPGSPVVSVHPVILPASAKRGVDLAIRVSAPADGGELPVLVFSHGTGSSALGYGPLTDFWAAHGFVVVQPTHLDSRSVSLPEGDPRRHDIWRHRVDDDRRILDELDSVIATVPGLPGRVDPTRIAVAGHSFGGNTVGNLLGLQVHTAVFPDGEDLSDTRVKAGVLLATAGAGGSQLAPFARGVEYLNVDFSKLNVPTLVVSGDEDDLPFTVAGPAWTRQPFELSPGAEALLTLSGAEHSLGGIAGYEAAETTDENLDRVELIQQASWAFLRHALGIDDADWMAFADAFTAGEHPLGALVTRHAYSAVG